MDIKKVLVANRGEIAIRIFRACAELNIKTVGIYTHEDRYSLHRYKADESYPLGDAAEPLKPYLDMDEIIWVARQNDVDAIHPGYGFLSENAQFARKCAEAHIEFIGPSPDILEKLGNKETAKVVAQSCNVPIIQSNTTELSSANIALQEAQKIGYPLMLKAASGGGGRGMRVVRKPEELQKAFPEARREAENAFGDATVFLEKYVETPKHIEVQLAADRHGNVVHLFERDCSVQRRFQKVVEVAPSLGVPEPVRQKLFEYATAIARKVNYTHVGTAEFLVDKDWNIFFIEINPRIQVEHTVTEMVTGVDIIKTQIFVSGGYKLSDEQIKIKSQEALSLTGYAMQCRITTEDPENDFQPDYGTITTYRSAAGFGIRLDAGSLYQGVTVSPFFDSMLVKVSAHSRTLDGACRKMDRALREFRIRGVKTNIPFLLNLIRHPKFRRGEATVNFIKAHPELFEIQRGLDRATKSIKFLGDIIVNGHPNVPFVDKNKILKDPKIPEYDRQAAFPKGSKDRLSELGPEGFSQWLLKQKEIQFTDTTMRDAHQSLLATRVRTIDMLAVAEAFAKRHPQTFSMEVWGGATFDVCMRFLYENPWKRLAELRKAMPNLLLQMLLRGSNAVGYKAYPDNLVEKFIIQSWKTGVDVFRIFDSLNWLPAMEHSIHTVREKTEGIAEVCICYTGDILNPGRSKYNLNYYVDLAKSIEKAGAHILAIKDMAGLLKPYAATELIGALKANINLPIHLHTHDTSSLQLTTYLKAVEAGVDVMDVALGGLSGLTSQPNFNSAVEMLRFTERAQEYDIHSLNEFSRYWEQVRELYYPFESGLKTGTAEVFNNEIPGGQYSNLKPQAEALGLGDKFEEIKRRYQEVNELFGDITKVTPSSKVVGDMALFMVSQGLTIEDIWEKGKSISFPESVQSFFRGDLGQPPGGFPTKIQKIVLKGQKPFTERPNAHLERIDFEGEWTKFLDQFQEEFGRELNINDFLSWKLYPKVWEEAYQKHLEYDDVSKIPTQNFFYGMEPLEETMFEIAPGKTIIVKLLSVGPADERGMRTLFFQVNGQTRNIDIADKSLAIEVQQNPKANAEDPLQYAAPLQGRLSKYLVAKGDIITKNNPLFIIEAMKMETTVTAHQNGVVASLTLAEGSMVKTGDLLLQMQEEKE